MGPEEKTNNPEPEATEQGQAQTSTEESVAPSEVQEQGTGEEGKQPEADLPTEEDAGAETETSFTDKVDPEKLSPELKKVYKNMQADYTRKMQKVKSIEPKYQEAEKAKQVLQQLWSDPEFQKWRVAEVERRKQGAGQAEPEPDLDEMSEEERVQYQVDKAVKENTNKMKQEFEQTYGTFINSSRQEKAQKAIQGFRDKHPEAKDAELSALAPVIRQHGLTLEQAYVLKYPDRFKQQAVDKARGELKTKKNANLETGSQATAAPQTPDKPSLDQALAAARKELGWK